MQLPPQDPTNPSGQSSPYSRPEQASTPPSSGSVSPTSPLYQPSPYAETGSQFAPPPPLSSPQGNYSPEGDGYYNQVSQDGGPITQYRAVTQEKLVVPPITTPPRNGWRVVSLVLFILVLILGTTTTALVLTRPNPTGQPLGQTTSTPSATQPVVQTTPTSVATQPAQSTPTSTSNNYAATQPGPGCDTGGGTWTPQGLGNIVCGTQVTPTAAGTWGYLYLQLPNNTPFAASNKITVTGNLGSNTLECFGLAEQDANTGFLVTYCGNGAWSISAISNKGIITQPLLSNISSTRAAATISLALNANTLVFTIDTETHQFTVSPLQPVKVSIAYEFNQNCTNCFIPSISTNNFSYITPAS